MKTNEILQKDVQDAIKWEPLLHAAEIGVTAKDGVITLSGTVNAYLKKIEAGNAAKNVAGVKAVVEKIEVRLSGAAAKTDNEIAVEVVKILHDSWTIPSSKLIVKVEDACVTLEGILQWNFQRVAAKNALICLPGIKAIVNRISIQSEIHDMAEKKEIEEALARNWSINVKNINVKVSGTQVILSGIVPSMHQKEAAENIAWNTPGVWFVINELAVEHNYSHAY